MTSCDQKFENCCPRVSQKISVLWWSVSFQSPRAFPTTVICSRRWEGLGAHPLPLVGVSQDLWGGSWGWIFALSLLILPQMFLSPGFSFAPFSVVSFLQILPPTWLASLTHLCSPLLSMLWTGPRGLTLQKGNGQCSASEEDSGVLGDVSRGLRGFHGPDRTL